MCRRRGVTRGRAKRAPETFWRALDEREAYDWRRALQANLHFDDTDQEGAGDAAEQSARREVATFQLPALLARWQIKHTVMSELSWDLVFKRPKRSSPVPQHLGQGTSTLYI